MKTKPISAGPLHDDLHLSPFSRARWWIFLLDHFHTEGSTGCIWFHSVSCFCSPKIIWNRSVTCDISVEVRVLCLVVQRCAFRRGFVGNPVTFQCASSRVMIISMPSRLDQDFYLCCGWRISRWHVEFIHTVSGRNPTVLLWEPWLMMWCSFGRVVTVFFSRKYIPNQQMWSW